MPRYKHAQDQPPEDRASCCSPKPRVVRGESACCATHEDARAIAIDPVCQMKVDRFSPPGGALEMGGQMYFFGSTFCRTKFAGSEADASH